ncbi:protein of unknown function [Acidithiobacillus ferrivorans]|uniref:Uncharacterized protein n=1 Tax=Acidithiobacillus ferrivorans TaxID=160808 RepID=A0A060UYM6_9PROT|nr:hypothetical protein AFERRI_600044 [Acidithiobacillus ferrivorans]SMH65374.1 protein of unknown function [Acidithiobacillus ferrivorans]
MFYMHSSETVRLRARIKAMYEINESSISFCLFHMPYLSAFLKCISVLPCISLYGKPATSPPKGVAM